MILRPEIFAPFGELVCALSTRDETAGPSPYGFNLSFNVGDDAERVRRNRAAFFAALSLDSGNVASPQQVHGGRVVRAHAAGSYAGCDGLLTDRPNLTLTVLFADCVPVFLFDPRRRAIGAIHAGWRGTSAGIASAAVAEMQHAFGSRPSDLLVHVGPGAGSCCYRVGPEVAGLFAADDLRREEDAVFLDLKSANARQLRQSGVPVRQIEISPHCTISESFFHSNRRDGRNSGRMMGVIVLTG